MAGELKHWTWITTDLKGSDEEWKCRLGRMREAGIDAILPEIFNNHHAAYGSDHLPVAGRWLEQLLPLAGEAGIEVHAWMHAMTCTVPEIVAAHPDWYAVNAKGESTADKPAYVGYYKFFCPSRPEVHDFLRRRVTELAAYPGLASVHLDYIRLPDVILASALQPKYGIVQDREYPQYDYCYCSVCRAAFQTAGGADPLSLADPSADPAWRRFRCDRITSLVTDHLAPTIRSAGKEVTAAVFPNWQHVRQEWSRWGLEAVLPMLYHTFYHEGIDWIRAECAKGVASLGPRTSLYSGLFVPALTPDELTTAIRASLEGGARGVSLFASGSMTEEHWQAFARVNRELGKPA
ncbi:MAG: Tat pathway signal protein [Candidatus Latescibacterota bacterium]|jgi:uncharacterized lipoprotein YddW (UPF0748 family)